MSNEQPANEPSVIVVSPETTVSTDGQGDPIKKETEALIEAIKRRAQAEIQAAGDLTRETYLNAVRQAREAIEKDKLVDRDRIEESIQHLQQEAEKNWQSVQAEIEAFGSRLKDAAQTAWEKLTQPKSD
jgi:molecular chaperone DnaK (HSP70)